MSHRIRPLVGGLAAVLLAGCSGSNVAAVKSTPTIAPNGKQYAYDTASLASSRWPNPCSLVTEASAAAAVGSTVTTKRFHAICYWIPQSDLFPVLSLRIRAIGNDPTGTYEDAVDRARSSHPASVSGVGKAAVSYRTTGPTTVLELLAGQGAFQLSFAAPHGGSGLQPAKLRAGLVTVGKTLASEFRG